MWRILQISFRNLFERKITTFLLGFGLLSVTFLFVLMMGLGNGVEATILRSATTLSTGHVNINGFYKVSPSASQFALTDYAAIEAKIREVVPEVDYIVPRWRGGFDRVISDSNSLTNAIVGVDISKEQRAKDVFDVLSGDLEDLAEPGTAMLFKQQAEDLDVKVGDTVVVTGKTARGMRNTIDVRVVAIVKDMGILSRFSTYLNRQSHQELYGFRSTTTGALYVYLKDRKDAAKVSKRLRDVLGTAGYDLMEPESKSYWRKQSDVNREDWTGQRLDVGTWRDEVSELIPIVDGIRLFSTVLILVLLGIIIAGVIITMLMSVRERTQEIGTMRAIGLSRLNVVSMIVSEALLLAVMFAAAGALIAIGVVAALNASGLEIPNEAAKIFLMSDVLVLDIDLGSVISAVLTISIVTVLAALIPAIRAARITPAAAMRHAT
ncbi:MAG: putative ABC transport system permease protein [Myxococcota bacterium]|jgi:putative ABC transport system permease protein